MTQSILPIIAFVAGAAVTAAIFAFIGAGRRKKIAAEALARAEAQDSVSALLADADAIEANFRAGALAPDNFRRSLNDKAIAATRMIRTHMSAMDVFFVKYAEMQVREYMRALENPERRETGLAAPERDAAWHTAAAPSAPAAPVSEFMPEFNAVASQPLAVPAPTVPLAPPIEIEPSDDSFEPAAKVPPPVPIVPEPLAEASFEPVLEDVFDQNEAVAPLLPPEPEIAPERVPELIQTPAAAEFAPPVVPGPTQKPLPAEPVLGEPVLGEPVLGEPDDAEFDLSAIATPAPAAPPPAAERGVDAWSDKSIEEFEAAFAQFEDEPAAHRESAETGAFPAVDAACVPEAPAAAPAIGKPVAQAGQPPAPQGRYDDHTMTETSSIDKAAIMNALAAAQQAQTPQQPQSVHKQASVQPPPAQTKDQPDQQGITGDDVVDVIDSFFNLK